MKTVLIVDDDALARVGIKSINDFEQRGYKIVGEAENGEIALNIAKELKPDIILSDIKMPGLNGVELIEECIKNGINSTFIMLSSHDDFNYVRTSMKLGALDYILKIDMKKNQIVDLLDFYQINSSKQINQINQVKDYETISNIINQGKPINELNLEKLSYKLKYNKKLPYLIALVKLVEFSSALISDTDLQRIKTPCLNFCSESIKNFSGAYVQHLAGKSFICFIPISLGMMDKAKSELALTNWGNTMTTMFKNVLDIKTVIGFSTISFSLSNFIDSFNEANKAAIDAIKNDNVYSYYEKIKQQKINNDCSWMNSIDQIRKNIFSFNKIATENNFNTLIEIFSSNNTPISNIRAASYIILFICSNYFNSIGYVYDSEKEDELFISKETNLLQFINWLQKIKIKLIKSMSEENGTQKQIIAAKKFITINYKEQLTLNNVAKEVGLSPTYFSKLFYQSTEQKFIDYLTEIRIEQSRILLETSCYKIQAISEMVGYDNATYFSYLFKKNIGITPQEYRNKATKNKIEDK